MLWVLGIAALLQQLVLPGAILLRLLRLKGLNSIERAVGIFAFSLMVNHLLVVLFTAGHLQSPVTWCALIAAEILYLSLDWRASLTFWKFDLQRARSLKSLAREPAVAGILLFACIAILIGLFHSNWASVYNGTDDVANWDHWATEWASGSFPALTGLYPQLLPANGSLSYLLIGNFDIKLFSKATTPLYTLAAVLLFLSLAIRRRDASYLIGGAIYTLMVFHYMGTVFMTYGYADLPVAFFGFLAFYCIAAHAGRPTRLAILAMLFFSIGALLTKQGGVYAVLAAVAYTILWKSQAPRDPSEPRLLQRDLPTALLIVFTLFCTAWYTGKFVQIHLGTDSSNMVLLTQVMHRGRNYLERVVAIYGKFLHDPPVNAWFTIPLSLLLLASLFFKRTRALTAFLIFPFLLAYAFWFSYEIRNCLMAFPLVAVVCGVTIHELLALHRVAASLNQVRLSVAATALLGFCLRYNSQVAAFSTPIALLSLLFLALSYVKFSRPQVIPAGALALCALAAFTVWCSLQYPREAVLAQQVEAARQTVGDPAITAALYQAARDRNTQTGIVTYYWFLRGLPGINRLFRRTGACHPCTVKALESALQQYPQANFILMPDGVMPPETIHELANSPEFVTVFDIHGWRLLEKQLTWTHSTP